MSARTIEELTRDALSLRSGLLEKNLDPLRHNFVVSPEELAVILSQPFVTTTVNHSERRFCGLKLQELFPERSVTG